MSEYGKNIQCEIILSKTANLEAIQNKIWLFWSHYSYIVYIYLLNYSTKLFIHCFRIEMEFRGVGLCGSRKTEEHGENLWNKDESKLNPHDARSGKWTQATLVGGEHSPVHHRAISAILLATAVLEISSCPVARGN